MPADDIQMSAQSPFAGKLFLVVGPSGVGKDTLLEGARDSLKPFAAWRFPSRYITRAASAGGEDYIPLDDATFAAMLRDGAFFHHWQAHGLKYGLPGDIADDLLRGVHVVVNVSRRELCTLMALWPDTMIILIEASAPVVAARLKARGREDAAEVEARIARRAEIPPLGRPVVRVHNDGTREQGIAALVQTIVGSAPHYLNAGATSLRTAGGNLCILSDTHPAAAGLRAHGSRVELVNRAGTAIVAELAYDSGPGLTGSACLLEPGLARRLDVTRDPMLEIRPSPTPASRAVLQRKIRGAELSESEIERVVDDMVHGRYSQTELAGFLVSAANGLTTGEVAALARARAARTENLHWDAPIVVDKHSMGGIPGNRITPIIIPIVTAAGLVMPKTSSRAITSASGTADAMEVMARVDLSPEDLCRVVRDVGGCIAWNGNLTQSPVDDVMNAINRPLGLKSSQLDVSSILSKKLAAGSTHVLIDMPVGPEAKTRNMAEARALETLFVTVAASLGLQARVMVTDGTRPVGRGVGPVLEMRDVLAVLNNHPEAPQDLRAKALLYAGTILDWADPDENHSGAARAEALLLSGAAAARFERIVDAQGRRAAAPPDPAPLSTEIASDAAFRLSGFSVASVSAIARAAGAPFVPGAGLDLLIDPGQPVAIGTPLMRIHATTAFALHAASALAQASLACGALCIGTAPGDQVIPAESKGRRE